ncbi:hypothetical protein LRS10_01730 [Phenylobacterium sp. J426]|uniref:hypothetical protein n=1 Tax=Phenylobacterium sp. J426 TaxID=2898439 RepID=UPI00215077B3|nr:hypothetical protein [Phenylobacterium sp. J426]MCR5873027.1 hypothetical protein [Phenylobacterium sp. J426]
MKLSLAALGTTLGLAAALSLGGGALANDDGPMATAGASGSPPTGAEPPARERVAPHAAPARPMTTEEQIDAFIRSSPAAAPSVEEMAALDEAPERQVHGSVEVGVGTHGYRHARVEAHYPMGKTGHLSVAVGTTRGKGLVGACPGGALGGPYGGGLAPFPGPQGCHAPW